MIRPTRYSRRCVVSAVAATVLVAAAGPALADVMPSASGWWWIGRPTVILPGVATPDVPPNGLYVAGGHAGPTGISALRFNLAPQEAARTLVLTVADATGALAIVACPSSAAWAPAEDGGWDQRAQADCSTSVAGAVNDDQSTITFELSDLQGPDGVVDIVLSPGTDPETGAEAQVEVVFDPPVLLSVDTVDPDDTGAKDPIKEPSEPTATMDPGPVARAQPPAAGSPPTVRLPEPGSEVRAPDVAPPPVNPSTEPVAINSMESLPSAFAYPGILGLPLLLIGLAGYLGWALSCPVTVAASSLGTRGSR